MIKENQVIIIYSASDNNIEGKHRGWVENFNQLLQMILQQLSNIAPSFTLSSEKDHLEYKDLSKYDIMITIVSPAFLINRKRHQVLKHFLKVKGEQGIPIEKCLLKVSKVLTDIADQPALIKSLTDYPLFAIDQETGRVMEYRNFLDEKTEDFFWMKMVDLAYDISGILTKDERSSNIRPIYSKKAIYLAHVDHELQIQRTILRKELLRYGHTVLPEKKTHRNLEELKKQIQSDMDKSDFSIHLIGNQYGETPFGGHQSIMELQHRSAVERCRQVENEGPNFLQLIWLKPELKNLNEQQRAFIERLKREADNSASTEILQSTLEAFKNIVRNELFDWEDKGKEDPATSLKTNKDQPSIYFIYDKVDQARAKPLIDMVKSMGYNLLLPAFNEDIFFLRKQHHHNLMNFDYAFIYQHQVNNHWVKMKLLDLLKSSGFGRKKSVLGKMFLKEEPSKDILLEGHLLRDLQVEKGKPEKLLQSIKSFFSTGNHL